MVFEGDLSGFTFGIGKVKGLTLHNISSDLEAFQFIIQDKDITGFSILDGITFKGDIETGVNAKNNRIIYKNCNFLKSVNRRAVADKKYKNYCIFDNCTFDLTNAYEFVNCKVKNSTIDISPYKRGFRGVYFENCTITSSNANSKAFQIYYSDPTYIVGCVIKDVNIVLSVDIKAIIKNCILENVTFSGSYKNNIIQENNIII